MDQVDRQGITTRNQEDYPMLLIRNSNRLRVAISLHAASLLLLIVVNSSTWQGTAVPARTNHDTDCLHTGLS